MNEQATAASSYQQDSQTKRTSSIGKREQAISRELGGQQHAPIDTTDVNEQQQRATGQQDGEDSGRKREQAISRERGGGCGRTSNSSKQQDSGGENKQQRDLVLQTSRITQQIKASNKESKTSF